MSWIKLLFRRGISWSWTWYGKSLKKNGIIFNEKVGESAGKADKGNLRKR